MGIYPIGINAEGKSKTTIWVPHDQPNLHIVLFPSVKKINKGQLMDSTATPDTRQKIFNAAMELFSENGFHATTTRVIAQFAGVNEVTLFRHFKSKQQLFFEILEHVKQVGFDTKRLVETKGLGPSEAIRFVVLKFIETMEEHPKEFKIMFQAVMDEIKEFESEFIGKHYVKLVEFLENAFVGAAKEAGKEHFTNAELHAQLLLANLMGISIGRILGKSLPIRKRSREEICEYTANLYLNVM